MAKLMRPAAVLFIYFFAFFCTVSAQAQTPSPTPYSTATPTNSPYATPTPTVTFTATDTPYATPSPTATLTPTVVASFSPTPTPKLHCKIYEEGQCTVDGIGPECTLANAATVCKFTCEANEVQGRICLVGGRSKVSCVPDGPGVPVANNACKFRCDPTTPGMCTETGTGPACREGHGAEDCKLGCEKNHYGSCVMNGTEGPCSRATAGGNDPACRPHCTPAGQCIYGGTGPSCEPEAASTVCKLGCDASNSGQCIYGGTAGDCSNLGYDASCKLHCSEQNPSECLRGLSTGPSCTIGTGCKYYCDTAGDGSPVCLLNGSGKPCSVNAGCSMGCIGVGMCGVVSNDFSIGGVRSCSIANQATDCKKGCSTDLQCVPGGQYGDCTSPADCAASCSLTEGSVGSCVANGSPGAGGPACTSADASACHATCDSSGSCEFGENGGGSCTASYDCKHCEGATCVIGAAFPGQLKCVDDSQCNQESRNSQTPGAQVANAPMPQRDKDRSKSVDPAHARKVLAKLDKGRPSFGSKSAPVHMYFFLDLTCGMCKYLARNVFKKFQADYIDTGKVRATFVEFPLGMMQGSVNMAEAALCAHEENKYMKFLNLSLADDANTEDFKIVQQRLPDYEKQLKLVSKKYADCRTSHRYLAAIQAGAKAGASLGVRGTPSYFINGITSGGARTYPEFKALADKELAKVSRSRVRISKSEKRRQHSR